jgi:glycosyltransferase involved in cell wall biosynthesis
MTRRLLIWFWSGGGGGSQFALRLAQRLMLHFGADAVTLSLRSDDPILALARDVGVNALAANIISDRRRPLETLESLARSERTLASHAESADIVIVPMNFAVASVLSGRLRQPIVYCAHDPEPHPGDYASLAQRFTQSLLLRRATRVVALSNYAAGLLRRNGFGDKLHTVPLGSVFRPEAASSRAGGEPCRFLFAGRMIAYKGLDVLADAIALLSPDEFELTLAGAGPALTAALIERFRSLGAKPRDGWLSEGELDVLMRHADVVAAPYTSATQSGVVAQAMALGRPCVVTPVGALPEQVADTGWIAKGTSPRDVADAMQDAISLASRTHKASLARENAERLWSEDHWSWLSAV